MGLDAKISYAQINTFNLNGYLDFMIMTRSVAFTKESYDKVSSIQHAMNPHTDDGYSFDDAVNRIIKQCKMKEVLPKK